MRVGGQEERTGALDQQLHSLLIPFTEKEPESESAKRLLQSKWNPKQHSDGAWRFDV